MKLRMAPQILEEYRKNFPQAQFELRGLGTIRVVCIYRNHEVELGRYSDGMRLHVAACIQAIDEYEEKGEKYQEVKKKYNDEVGTGKRYSFNMYSMEDFLVRLMFKEELKNYNSSMEKRFSM